MKWEKIEIETGDARYWALVGRGLMAKTGELARAALTRNRCAIIADENSARLFATRVSESLATSGFQPITIVAPSGESSKSLRETERICDEMSAAGLDRQSFVIGLGGGVIGDLSGFVAAIFLRGVPHIQIPTTLLAMVDSAIGGKTGVNLVTGKNLAGAFHQPALVIVDVAALDSLPPREMRQGLAEMVKHAVIRDAEMFAMLSQRSESGESRPSSRAKRSQAKGSRGSYLNGSAAGSLGFARDDGLIARNIRIKAEIVSADARENSGERALLNFGHTIGHGVERASNYKIPHGDCVSLGIIGACTISMKRAGFSAGERDQIVALLGRLELPTRLPDDVDRKKIIEAIQHDKKFESGEIRFVVTPKIGSAHLSDAVTMEDLREAIAAL